METLPQGKPWNISFPWGLNLLPWFISIYCKLLNVFTYLFANAVCTFYWWFVSFHCHMVKSFHSKNLFLKRTYDSFVWNWNSGHLRNKRATKPCRWNEHPVANTYPISSLLALNAFWKQLRANHPHFFFQEHNFFPECQT